MQFTPKKESELSRFEPLPAGEYPFTVLESDEVASKSVKNSGKMMLKIKLNVHGEKDAGVYDYFADWFSEWKLKHFFDTIGASGDYESGNIDGTQNAFAGRVGMVRLGIEDSGTYGLKNVVDDYVVVKAEQPTKSAKPKPQPAQDSPGADDVPF